MAADRADLVIVGGGTVGGWASYFAKVQGAGRVIARDLALEGKTSVAEVHDLGLDRFDDQRRCRLPTDPIALPFPVAMARKTS
jgi:glycine/D-amino acid oxidase-like deaminating enzyme